MTTKTDIHSRMEGAMRLHHRAVRNGDSDTATYWLLSYLQCWDELEAVRPQVLDIPLPAMPWSWWGHGGYEEPRR